jgi:zinc transport system substrate-binding protein
MRCHVLAFGLAGALFSSSPPAYAADDPKVVVSMKPIHSLVASVMEGTGTPDLLVKGPASAHTYSMRPADAKTLSRSKVVFWVGAGMENFLVGPLGSLGKKAKIVALGEAEGLTLRPYREGASWEVHERHDDDGKRAGAGHAHEREKRSGAAGQRHDEHGHDEHGGHDMHVWLDPLNAKAMVPAIVRALSEADKTNAARYAANGKALETKLDALDLRLKAELAPLQGRPFVVFHDAYQYLERRYGVEAVGSITASPDRPPGAERLREIRRKIEATKAACVFAEPQFEPRLVRTVTEGTGARTGTLDPHGASYEPGPNLYFDLLEGLSEGLRDCLVEPS